MLQLSKNSDGFQTLSVRKIKACRFTTVYETDVTRETLFLVLRLFSDCYLCAMKQRETTFKSVNLTVKFA
jgi:hypothetical protein